MVLVGSDTKTFSDVHIGDTERRSGLYILGKPGMGKSTLLVNLLLQDIEKGNSCFFLDPHGQAIDDILERSPHLQKRNVVMLNPASDDCAFGINPLYCPDITSRSMRAEAENKAKSIFERIFESGNKEEVWLPLILENALPVLIETGYTLAEMPFFLFNRSFREFVLKQVKYSARVIDFWNYEFKAEQMQPALVRIRRLLGGEYVRYIIGQQRSAIDFGSMVCGEGNVILLRLSPTLSEDARRFIGTIVVTELLTAIKGRNAEQRKKPFSIFVDEFQHFATDQFAEFINEGRKFGCQVAVSHQERVGQFGENQKILGATMACANKIIFQCTVRDARELAPEFAEKPTFTETRKIPELVISKDPVWDLVAKGHTDNRIQELVVKHLYPLYDIIFQYKEAIEKWGGIHVEFMDQATQARDIASIASVDNQGVARYRGVLASTEALGRMESALDRALGAHQEAESATRIANSYKHDFYARHNSIKEINRFLTELMQGRISLSFGQEIIWKLLKNIYVNSDFENGGIWCKKKGNEVDWLFKPVYEFYWQLQFGDPSEPRAIPGILAFKYFRSDLRKIYQQKWYPNDTSDYMRDRMKEFDTALISSDERGQLKFSKDPRLIEIKYEEKRKNSSDVSRFPELYYPNPHTSYLIFIPDLPERVLTGVEIKKLKDVCIYELMERKKEGDRDILRWTAEMLELCQLLTDPENHVKVPSGVYREVAVHISSTQEMINQAVQTLTEHPKYTASYKTIANRDGEEVTEKGIMRTNDFLERRRNYPFEPVCIGRTHDEIDAEIAERREGWRKSLPRGSETRPSEEKPPQTWESPNGLREPLPNE